MQAHATLDIANLGSSYPLPLKITALCAATHTVHTEKRYFAALNQQLLAHPSTGFGLYIHLPFCDWQCAYCANDKITQHQADHGLQYVHYLQRELALHAEFFLYPPQLTWLHVGGGNPAMLSEEAFIYLMQCLHHSFQFAPEAHWCIEVDPRTINRQRLAFFRGLGFHQLRFEMLDIHVAVQRAIKRQQSMAQVQSMVAEASALGFSVIEAHMTVGLPMQHVKGLARTLKQCLRLKPDHITLTPFVHQPTQFSAQKVIANAALPNAEQRDEMLQIMNAQLLAAGYQSCNVHDGMQSAHFFMRVIGKEPMAEAILQKHALPPTNLFAFGVSAISKMGDCYRQNCRTLHRYYRSLDQHCLPIWRCEAR